MKTCELMFNDWVYCPTLKKPIQIEFGYQIEECVELGFKPISLSPEILEKIGFKKVEQSSCANPFYWELVKYEDEDEDALLYRIEAYKTPFYGMFIDIHNPSDCESIIFTKQIVSVHELQHAFKLCEIDLEIIL